MAKRSGIFLIFTASTLMVASAYWLLFSVFMVYDDEGYVLISLKNYSAHGGLYSHVFSQYGPFFYVLHDLGHRLLGYEFTNTTGRLITLLCWTLATFACAHLIWRQTRSVALTGFTLGLTFFYLIHMVSEPVHPGGMIAALVALGAWAGSTQIKNQSMRGLAIISGLIGAALFLTKINVGVFFLLAAGTWFVIQLREIRWAAWATLAAAVLLTALPFVLMHSELGETWCLLFATVSAISILTMLAVVWRGRQPLTTWGHVGWSVSAMLIIGVPVVCVVCLRGTEINDLVEGILLNPLRHPGIYHYAPAWNQGTSLACFTSLVLAILVWRGYGARLAWLFIAVRLILALVFSVAAFEYLPVTSHSFALSYVIPLAWIFAVRLAPEDQTLRPALTAWLGLLLVLQVLHAYPVAGSQISWGTFLIIPLMALGLHDAQLFIITREKRHFSTMIGVVSLLLATVTFGRVTAVGWLRYSEDRALQLSGAENLRLPEEFASALRVLTLNATAHGDMLFTLPGMYSFNQWTQLPTPTLANTTHWFSLLSKQQQDEIAAELTRSTHPVLIFQRDLITYLTDNKFIVASPLYEYLRLNFERVFTIQQFEFWVRRGRTITPINTCELLQLKTPEGGMAPFKLEMIAAIPSGQRIAAIDLVTLDEQPRVLAHWDATSGPLFSQEVHLRGDYPLTENILAWNKPLPTLTRLTLLLTSQPAAFVRPRCVIYLRNAQGTILTEARFME